eukprot:TRINITY_DN4815_c0_g1_i1.p2 TRINITY_DN4815_c0_g1~~TRINITY_DN4815_c0_g1_i1.p2  ORF type:complete len:423 (+),score=152.11 TRINITY_DN4815_c0_g1_i1:48-1271(+)
MPEERRLDPGDGQPRTLGEFMERHGAVAGARLWSTTPADGESPAVQPELEPHAEPAPSDDKAAHYRTLSDDELARAFHVRVACAIDDERKASAVAAFLWSHVDEVVPLLVDDSLLESALIDAEDHLAGVGVEAAAADDDDAPAIQLRSRAREAAEEKRTDPTDGNLYTKAEFVAEYGGVEEWDAAAPKARDARPQRARGGRRHQRQPEDVAADESEEREAQEAGNRWLRDLEWPSEPPSRKTGLGISYEFLDHTADVILHTWAKTKMESWEQQVLAMFAYMVNDGANVLEDSVAITEHVDICVDALDEDYLLMKYMQEFLYHFANPDRKIVFREVRIVGVDFESRPMRLAARGWGELYRPHGADRHPKGTDVKAVTLECMRHNEPGKDTESAVVPQDCWSSYCIVDI